MTTITGIFHININCIDLERSKRFYELLGFRVAVEFPEGEYPDIGEGLAIGAHKVKGALMHRGENQDAAFLDLLEWIGADSNAQMTASAQTGGIRRIAFRAKDVSAEFERLRKEGVAFLSDPVTVSGPTGQPGKFVCFLDPDGNMLELIEVQY